MDDKTFNETIDLYIEDHWGEIVDDIARMVEVPSFEELDDAAPNAPFGPGPRAALSQILSIADRMGFATTDVDGYMGFADFKGASDTQIGIIGHVDVVPAGPGWHFDPFTVTLKDGCLMGRGTLDDKGPVVVTLWAMKFWKDLGVTFPYTIRFLFGANEETGMNDVPYYRERYADPAFLFTPDAEFPVCYGEKGGFDATITSKPIEDGRIVELSGGAATNAVPGTATALVRADAASLPAADRITVTPEAEGLVRIDAQGKSAHAATPETGVNAIGVLVDYLLANDLCSPDERAFLEFDQKLLSHTDGSGVGIACSDEYFGPLTVIGGTVALEDGRIVQTMDSRWPTSITPEGITKAITTLTDPIGATFENTLLMDPFLVKPDSPEIQALQGAYREVTGDDEHKPFTIGGGTYAREFTSGASFGPERTWQTQPDWVGGMHGPDEGISEDDLKTAMKIYALALDKLNALTF